MALIRARSLIPSRSFLRVPVHAGLQFSRTWKEGRDPADLQFSSYLEKKDGSQLTVGM